MNHALKRSWTCVLFDLDGTILDSGPGIFSSLTLTFKHLGLPVPAESELIHYVGPPLMHSFIHRAGMTEAEARNALQVYRTEYRKDGIFDAAVYPGIDGMLHALHAAGIPVALATSKPEVQARQIITHLGYDDLFAVIAGASDNETRSSKADIVAHALGELAELGVDTSAAVMVGDRSYDVEGAAAHGIPTIIVEWGYGSPEEAAGAISTVYSADNLRSLLLG